MTIRGEQMENLVVGTILNKEDWGVHVSKCDELHVAPHKALVSKSVLVSADTNCPSTPFLCYSYYVTSVNIDGDEEGEWLHFCLIPSDAAFIMAYAEEDAYLLREKHKKELEDQRPQRMKDLADDLDIEDEDPEEDLGTIEGGVIRPSH